MMVVSAAMASLETSTVSEKVVSLLAPLRLLRRGWGRFFGVEQPPSIPPEYRREEKQQYLSGNGTRAGSDGGGVSSTQEPFKYEMGT